MPHATNTTKRVQPPRQASVRDVHPRPNPRRPLHRAAAYFGLAYLLTWVLWIPANLESRGSLDLPVPSLLLIIIGGFGPLVAAVLVTARTEGRAGVRRLFAQLDPRRTTWRWFAAALLLLPLNVAPFLWHLATGGAPPSVGTVVQALVVLPFHFVFVVLVGGGLDEETGWRGYALPTLLQRWSPALTHVVLGAVWALWHLPMWLDPKSAHADYPLWLFVLGEIGVSVLIGWLYAGSGGSLAVAVVAHAVSNSADNVRYQLLGDRGGELGAQLTLMAVHLLAAGVVVVATRGRLGADRLHQDDGLRRHDRPRPAAV